MESRSVTPGYEQKTKVSQDPGFEQRTKVAQDESSTGSANGATASVRPDAAALLEQRKEQRRSQYAHPEGKVAHPHRCNDRLEDFIQALFEGNLRKNLPGPVKLFYQCVQSKPGEEPTDPFFYLKIDPPGVHKKESPGGVHEKESDSL